MRRSQVEFNHRNTRRARLTQADVYNIRAIAEGLPPTVSAREKVRRIMRRLPNLPAGFFSVLAVVKGDSFVEEL